MSKVRPLERIRQQPGIVLFCCMLAWCCGLIFFRVKRTGSEYFLFLIWNLFLACIPLFASRLLQAAHTRRIPDVIQLLLLAVWLVFLPNAPYILTDLIHLEQGPTRLYWYDMAMLLSCGGVGLLLGYSSMFDVHRVVEARFGQRVAWVVATGTLLLSGFGIYLGRALRWNSWDVVTNPRGLFDFIAGCLLNPGSYLHIWAISGLCGVSLLLGYIALHWMSSTRPVAAK
ncbi:MAG: DUF1361 domain-containing protein [Steroidobacteraceae bacterium]